MNQETVDRYSFQWKDSLGPIPGATGPTLDLPARGHSKTLTTEQWVAERKSPEEKLITVEQIPPEIMNKMQVMYKTLKSKYPKMKDKRIVRKVGEHFKLKFV